jgi:hypothetical protein
MNKRIQELAEQAGLLYPQFGPTVETRYMKKKEQDLEKFAELIVRECVKVMYDNAIERKIGLEIDKRPTYYAAAILEHFGTKE